MQNARPYEEQILKEISVLPDEALPKVLRLINLVREEFFPLQKQQHHKEPGNQTSHEKTRQVLATSKSNWAQELIGERENRL